MTCFIFVSFDLKVIHEVRTSYFVILDTPSSWTCTCAFSLHPLPFSMSVRILTFKEDMTETYFVNYFQSKNHKKRYKKEKLMCKAFGKCRTKGRALGIEVALCNCTGETGMDNFDSLNSSSFISICNKPEKKKKTRVILKCTPTRCHTLPFTSIYSHLIPPTLNYWQPIVIYFHSF